MKSKYEEVMDRVEVTPEMRARVLANVSKEVSKKPKTSKVISLQSWKKYSSLVAAVAILLIGVFAYNNVSRGPQIDTEVTTFGPQELASLTELQEAVGYEINELENLPFEPQEVVYISYDGIDGEIQYISGEDQIVYTKMTEIGSNNGHYESYDVVEEVEVAGHQVTLQGSGEGFQMASWDDGQYGYMIYSEKPISKEAMLAMID